MGIATANPARAPEVKSLITIVEGAHDGDAGEFAGKTW
jgi:hypothetical protein